MQHRLRRVKSGLLNENRLCNRAEAVKGPSWRPRRGWSSRARDGQRCAGGHRRPLLAPPRRVDLRRLVEARPDITLAEFRTALQRRCGVQAGLSPIHNAAGPMPPYRSTITFVRMKGPPRSGPRRSP
jgi:hypothetical protein